jgi:DNA primase catalytic core
MRLSVDVMGLHKLTAGDGYSYLTRQVAVHDSTEKGHANLHDYYEQKGESPGHWLGAGLTGLDMKVGTEVTVEQMKALFGEGRHPNAQAIEQTVIDAGDTKDAALRASALGRAFAVYTGSSPFLVEVAREFSVFNQQRGQVWNAALPEQDRARIRTDIGARIFADVFGRPPAEARELSGFIAASSRQATTAVAGFDLTFSPVKSVSTLWALAPREVAEQIEQAHHAAVADAIGWLESSVAYTRTGRAGVRQVDVQGIVAAAFTHRDSRAGDPDLHTHVAVSNKVQTLDGRWLALDGRVLYKAKVSTSERYNTRLEAELVERLGVRFEARASTGSTVSKGKRPVREIIGVDSRLTRAWSVRRAEIEVRRAELAARFQATHGRAPTEIEALGLAQQATLETREAKHEPRSHAEQRAAWRGQAIGVLGSTGAVARMVSAAAGYDVERTPVTDEWVSATAARVIDVVQDARATWQVWHVRAEAERQARADGIALTDLDTAVDLVVTRALSPASSIRLGADDPVVEPDVLRRRDGSSVYRVAGAALYTSHAIIDAEQRLLAAAQRRDGRAISAITVGIALAESAANGLELNPTQAQLVHELAVSGARLQLAVAPAGSGKTTAMRVLARAWISSGGDIVGLAPSAAAAAELREQIQTRSDTLAKLIHALNTGRQPRWVRDIGPQTLVIIDEAGMAGTTDLATAVDYILGRGASVRLIGDDQQLASVAAGGILRDLAETAGVVTLSELQRFTDRAEGAATLALRLGDPAALGYYLDNARVHVGDLSTVTDSAYQAWLADRQAGIDAVMLAPTRDIVAGLNARARSDRIATLTPPTGIGSTGREVALSDGNSANSGDIIISRRNDRHLPISSTDWVKNGDRWRVDRVHRTGTLTVTHLATRRTITLPADYVGDHVELGYASTVHTAQGITADTAHTVATGEETRQLFYVAMTRGRAGNHVYLATVSDGNEHAIIRPEAVLPPTATDILTSVLARDEAQQSAVSVGRDLDDPGRLLQEAVAFYQDALGVAAEHLVGSDTLTNLDTVAERLLAGLTTTAAYPTLRAHLALLAVDGDDPISRLRTALEQREIATALDPAAVLDWRLEPSRTTIGGPLAWLPAVPARLVDNDQWGLYLTHRGERITTLADHVRALANTWTPTSAPSWASALLDPADRRLRGDLAVWRSATGTDIHDRRLTGPTQLGAAASRYQTMLDTQAGLVLGDPRRAATRWAPIVDHLAPRVTDDDYWPELASRLAKIDAAGIDVRSIVTAAAGERPLPDDQPAAALWWRLARHLTPAAMAATTGSGAGTLRPPWTPTLTALLGAARAERILADPAWPALVAAVTGAPREHWAPEQLLTTAIDLTLAERDAIKADPPDNVSRQPELTDADLASALVWHVAMLTDPTPLDYDHVPADPYDSEPPEELWGPPIEWAAALEDAPDIPPDPAAEGADLHHASFGDLEPFMPDEEVRRLHLDRAIARAEILREPPLPTEDELWAPMLEEHKWAIAPVPKQRLLDLNRQAAEFFTARYPDSWARHYLQTRLGTDLTAAVDTHGTRFTPGYAPAGWTALTQHLRRRGATDEEILAAGLGRTARTGRIIDTFRDRLVFPIYHDDDLVGFIGRRNPSHDTEPNPTSGPKYLNTPQTDLFDKGAQLFGLSEARAALDHGATPTLVEGPLDVVAIALATNGSHIGVAPLGTSFTDAQANQLARHAGPGQPDALVAMDNDTAGRRSAQRAYWQITARRGNPQHAPLPEGLDPADMFRRDGAAALRHALHDSRPLAHAIAENVLHRPDGDQVAGGDVGAQIRFTVEAIAALSPDQWRAQIADLAEIVHAPQDRMESAVIAAAERWTDDPRSQARTQMAVLPPQRAVGQLITGTGPTDRWRALANSIDTRLVNDRGWPALAATIEQAAASGINVRAELTLLTNLRLPDGDPAQELRYRLLAAANLPAPAALRDGPPATKRAEGRHGHLDSPDRRSTLTPDPGPSR